MNDSNSLRDKGNAWKLLYAAYVMVESAPENYEAAYEDQDGNLHDIIVDYTSDEIKRNIKGKMYYLSYLNQNHHSKFFIASSIWLFSKLSR